MLNTIHFQTLGPNIRKNTAHFVLFVLFSLILTSPLAAAKKSKCPQMGDRLTAEQYCQKYADEARSQMQKYGVPASITLAQGMLESGYGSSYLAVVGNNHFGIKAYSRGWKGETIFCDDDKANEPFCKFPSVQQGFEYHSTFLRDNSRYAPLFRLDIRDYEGWANGLQRCGYATNPKYGSMLINLIETYNLDAYDVADAKIINAVRKLYVTKARGGLKYVRCLPGDDLAAIAAEFGIKERKLRSWNDLTKGAVLRENDIIYLEKKNKKADKGYYQHVVQPGESMWSISQTYGIRVKSLMKRNKLVSATVQTGQVLQLR